jgi:hypothetical protein
MPSVEEGRAFWRQGLADLNPLDLTSQNHARWKRQLQLNRSRTKMNTRELSILKQERQGDVRYKNEMISKRKLRLT